MDSGVNIARLCDIPDEHGFLRTQISPGPIAPPAADFTIGQHQRLRIAQIRFTLTTSAIVATRRAFLEILQSPDTLWRIHARATQARNQTRTYNFLPNMRDATAFVATELQTTLPNKLFLLAGQTLRLNVINGDGDDQITNIAITLEEFLDG